MTVSTTENRIPYSGNGATTVFDFPYKFLDTSDLKVYVDDELQTLTTDYSVGTPSDDGATVTFVVAPATGTNNIVILRDPDLLQESALPSNGPFPSRTVESMSDKLTLIVQRLTELLTRSFRLADSDTSGADTTLPSPEANTVIGWNPSANALQNVSLTTLATVVAFGTANSDVFDGDGVTTQFTLSGNPGALNNLDISIGGVTQTPGADYGWTSGTTLTFTSAPPAGTGNVLVRYMQGLPIADAESAAWTQVGTGAVQRTIGTKLRESASPEDFGAVGDGVTDDTTALLNMFASATNIIEFKPGANYLVTAALSSGANTTINGNGATITFDVFDTSNTGQLGFSSGSVARDLNVHLPTGAYAERLINIGDNCFVENLKVTSVDQIDGGDDNQDGCVRILGSNVSVQGLHVENFDKPVLLYLATNTDLSDFYCSSYQKGIQIDTSSITRLSRLFFNGISPNATTDPGNNAISGGGDNLSISDVQIKGSGEHAIYLANGAETDNLSISNVNINQCGQCGIKLRYWNNVNISNVSVIDCAFGNVVGTNEDALRLELCRNVTVSGYRAGREAKANCSNDGIHIDGCIDVHIDGFFADLPARAAVYLNDVNGTVNERVYLNGVGVGPITNTKPLVQVAVTGNLGTLISTNMYGTVKTVSAIQLSVGGSATGEYLFQGSITGDAAPLLNSSSIANIKTFMFMNGRNSDVNGSFQFRQNGNVDAGASVTEPQKGGLLLVNENGTAADGNIGTALSFTAINGGRRKAMIASVQTGANSNQTAIGLYSYLGTTTATDQVFLCALAAATDFRPGADNARTLGTTALRWSTVHAFTVRTHGVTVAGLTAAATAGAGARAFVTDANATTFASIVAGGGANGVPVYSDGTNWRIG
jgi:hypothetical protein